MRRISYIREGRPEHPGFDTALSRALLQRVDAGEWGETFRLHVPGRVVAFGRRDVAAPGYLQAVAAARAAGFDGVERLAGGRAAVFHEGTLAFSWTIPDPDPRPGIEGRYRMLADLMVRAYRRVGIATEVGEVPGEYCPGRFSVHDMRGRKVMGVGQRLARRAAHIGGVVVVSDARAVRDVLVPVYAALGIEWDPATTGALQDSDPAVTLAAVAEAIVAELATDAELVPSQLDPQTVDLGVALAAQHRSPDTVGLPA